MRKPPHRRTSRTDWPRVAGLLLAIPAACTPADDPQDQPADPVAIWQEAFDPGDAGFLSAVWGAAPDDVFIVGGQPDQGEVYHFDGAAWSAMAVPDIPLLIWVFGFGPTDVFAVGEQGTALRYDGSTWQTLATGTESDLWGIWGAAPTDIWAVGGEIDTGPPVLLHYDGTAWAAVPVPELDRAATALLKVWGTSATNVFAVGQLGVILHFDGESWRQVPSGTAEDLISLWGTAPDRIVAVGGRSNGVATIYDGATWTAQSMAPLPGLNGVFTDDADEALVVGLIGSAAVFNLDTQRIVTETTGTALTLHAVWGDGAARVYAVGGRATELPYRGIALVRTLP